MPIVGDEHGRGREEMLSSPRVALLSPSEEEFGPRHAQGRLGGGEAQQRETKIVIGIGLARRVRVDASAAAALQGVVSHEQVRDPVEVPFGVVSNRLVFFAEAKRRRATRVDDVGVVLVHGRDDGDGVAAGGERGREGAAHVPEPAGLAPRGNLRGDEDDGHAPRLDAGARVGDRVGARVVGALGARRVVERGDDVVLVVGDESGGGP